MINKPAQRIRYVRTPDGVQLAWAEAGAGPTLIKAANWMTHLEYEWESPAWERFCAEVLEFMDIKETAGEDPAFESLTAREPEVLGLITEGLGNAEIVARLWTRAQAMVFAHDRGFQA